jgi:UDP-3-O-[3-hydroxymyristoyl] glucosamine N-acyltransferase
MKILKIYLKDDNDNWALFEDTIPNLSNEFQKRNITIGDFISMGDNVKIGNNVKIENRVTIGNNVLIENDVSIGYLSAIGNGCVIDPDTTLYTRVRLGNASKIGTKKGWGSCHIHDNVIIGDNTVIECDKIGENSTIGDGVKIKAYSEISYNVRIDDNVKIGKYCFIQKECTIHKNVNIGKYSEINISGCVIERNSVIEDKVCFGNDRNNFTTTILNKITIGKNVVIKRQSTLIGSNNIGNNVKLNSGSFVPQYLDIPNNFDGIGKDLVSEFNIFLKTNTVVQNQKGVFYICIDANSKDINTKRKINVNGGSDRIKPTEKKLFQFTNFTETIEQLKLCDEAKIIVSAEIDLKDYVATYTPTQINHISVCAYSNARIVDFK